MFELLVILPFYFYFGHLYFDSTCSTTHLVDFGRLDKRKYQDIFSFEIRWLVISWLVCKGLLIFYRLGITKEVVLVLEMVLKMVLENSFTQHIAVAVVNKCLGIIMSCVIS